MWVASAEGAKAWAQALAQLRNRGLEEVLFVCCDGLAGLGEEIIATWPEATVQTCVVHLVRRSLGYAAYQDRKKLAAELKKFTRPVIARRRSRRCWSSPTRHWVRSIRRRSRSGNARGTNSPRSWSFRRRCGKCSTPRTRSKVSTGRCARC
ncbi:hypothetical protein ETD86_19770 [Nonomuraea turkmeniaca]|uniref:Mutator family transposase n=1 Tax=Nonomuraea turkmeniaca TaxID=103838 RepID=A0A5S4FI68_9ACTN|nr:hypothetical protein ETD86_19770 [Nonomuraea turkmeniaca]